MPTDRVPSTLYASGPVEFDTIEAAAGEKAEPPKFRMVAYTGGSMLLGGWPHPVVVDLSGMKVTAKARPILRDHEPGKVVGHTTTVDIQPARISVEGVLSADNLFSREVATSAGNGFPWQASIGAKVDKAVFVEEGESVTVNGRKFTGPMYVARRTTLGEISFVALGADDNTSARLAASAAASFVGVTPMKFEQWVEAKGFTLSDLNETQTASLTAAFEAEHKPAPAPKPEDGRPNVTATKTLDDVIAERRKEDARVEEITRLTAQAMNDRPFMTDEFEKMARAAIDEKRSAQEFELAVLRASRAPASIGGRGSHRDRKMSAKVIQAALCKAGGLKDLEKAFDGQTLEAADDRHPHGIGLQEIMLLAARENGFHDVSVRNIRGLLSAAMPPQDIRAQGWSTFSLAGILGDTANRFLNAGFTAVESSWRQIAATRSVTDFRAITSYSLTGGAMYEKVGPQGELKHAELGEESYTNRAETYGRMFAISRQDIINDDLGALTQIPQKLGRGGALALNDVFWTEFMDNGTFFTAARGNYDEDADTALSIGGLTLGDNLFRSMTDPDGYPIATSPAILLVPNGLTVTAAQLMAETRVIDGSGTTLQPASNPFAGKFRVVSSSYLSNTNYTGNSATAWYLLADPSDLPVIEVAFLNGRDTPIVESADADFNTLGVQFRGYHDFGVSLQEYRAGVKMAGVDVP